MVITITVSTLADYLKGLGILRLIVNSGCDKYAKAFWDKTSDCFVLKTNRTINEIEKYFLYEYQPTPLVSPWNGSTGFYPKDNKATINAIINSPSARFSDYRSVISSAQEVVNSLELTKQPTGEEKRKLLQKLRNNLPDVGVKWIDTCTLVTSEELKFPPLLGTGGNDGNFEFSRTFMQQLQEIFDFKTGNPKPKAIALLKAALFNEVIPGLDYSGKIGQFNPIASGGANATTGYEGDGRVNPWDFVLMLEGLLFFNQGIQKFNVLGGMPFTVSSQPIGYASGCPSEHSRGEIWLPTWSKPSGYQEIAALYLDGIRIGNRLVKTPLEFILGARDYARNKSIKSFYRFSFLQRNGSQNCFAVLVGVINPKSINPRAISLIEQLNDWINDFPIHSELPNALKSDYFNLLKTLFRFAVRKVGITEVVSAIGRLEETLVRFISIAKNKFIVPIPFLNWSHRGDEILEQALNLIRDSRYTRYDFSPIENRKNFLVWRENHPPLPRIEAKIISASNQKYLIRGATLVKATGYYA